jgi:HSP20 family molecular chaperone IbpA
MAQQAATSRSRDNSAPVNLKSNKAEVSERLKTRVAKKAYDLYERNGGSHGDDLAHWLRAEAEVMQRVPEIRESGSWYTINVPMQGFSANDVQISLDENDVLIAAERDLAESSDITAGSVRESLFLTAKWPSNVDPTTASAYLKDQNLTVTVKRLP